MKIYSNSIVNGYFDPKFGKHGTQFFKNMPSRSFHLAWDDLPVNTKSLALVFIDHDAITPMGFTWIHWVVANIDPALTELPENASVEQNLLQGVNSWRSPLLPEADRLTREEASHFGGCAPPDQPHRYTIKLYALNTLLDLKPGFPLNELLHTVEGHVLDKAKIYGWYRA
jgi:Raf kinase inhibitor-like YbhB/YbcL family protein